MASWRAPGSILEVPGSIFEAPRLHLGGFWNDFFEIFGQNAKKAKNAQSAQKNHKYQRPAKKGHRSQICRTAKGGWAAD